MIPTCIRCTLAAAALILLSHAATSQAAIIHRWSFNDATSNDSIGTMHGTLQNGAAIVGNRLQLDGVNDYMITSALGAPLGARTLMAWVSLDNLAQRSGSALTVGNMAGVGDSFDGIVYGERLANQWMNGSNGFARSVADNLGASETVTNPGEVMIAITYDNANQITIYRDGIVYATAANTSTGTLQTYTPPQGIALIGVRHEDIAGGAGTVTGNDQFLAGFVNEARIYDAVLTPTRIAELFSLGPDQIFNTPEVAPIPEPGTLTLLGCGIAGLAALSRRRTRQQPSR